jgi:FtsZ-interacting cell division protein YlmF
LAVRRSDSRLAVHGSLATEASASDELKAALDNAVALNAFNVQAGHDPRVRLQAVVRFAPTDYEPAVGEIARYFRAREVISIDLTNLYSRHAVRLVDFCSGMAVMCSGWIFRVTDNVIVLTPPG